MGPVTRRAARSTTQLQARPLRRRRHSCARPPAASAPASLVLPSGQRDRARRQADHDRAPARLHDPAATTPTSAAATPRSGARAAGLRRRRPRLDQRHEGQRRADRRRAAAAATATSSASAPRTSGSRRPDATSATPRMTDQVLDILKLVAPGTAVPLLRPRPVGGVERGPRGPATLAPPAPHPVAGAGRRRAATVAAARPTSRKRRQARRTPKGRARAGSPGSSSSSPSRRGRRRSRSAARSPSAASPACTITIADDTFVSQLHARVFDARRPADGRGPRLDQRHVPQRQPGSSAPSCSTPATAIQIGYTVLEAQ